ncbi:hypothetical protein D2M30_4181 [Bacillus amyloliquefaciens]|uniref:hypothetical protein n=1 Tax=Bacillus amyloliquefaciens TaxID=1390 RepID=UPI0010C47034|nr:hypothetical protein [Bacillus amyloliquefaciens]QBG58480.1 hypothetical protein D2M30_4181 [Bacillus amyloliquefaciens]
MAALSQPMIALKQILRETAEFRGAEADNFSGSLSEKNNSTFTFDGEVLFCNLNA